MQDSIVYGIADGDPKGTTGIGTIFYVDVTIDGVTTRNTWGLLEQISGKVDPTEFTRIARERMKAEAVERHLQKEREKQQALVERESSVKSNSVIDPIIKAVVTSDKHTKAIAEFKAGKEKALNALVGAVIGEIKKQQLRVDVDAFTINRLIQQQLKDQHA